MGNVRSVMKSVVARFIGLKVGLINQATTYDEGKGK